MTTIKMDSRMRSNETFRSRQGDAAKIIDKNVTYAQAITALNSPAMAADLKAAGISAPSKPGDINKMNSTALETLLLKAITLGALQSSPKIPPMWEIEGFSITDTEKLRHTGIALTGNKKPISLDNLSQDNIPQEVWDVFGGRGGPSDTSTAYALPASSDGNSYYLYADNGYYQLAVQRASDKQVVLLADGSAKTDPQGSSDTPVGPYSWHKHQLSMPERAQERLSLLAAGGSLQDAKNLVQQPATDLSDEVIREFARLPLSANTNGFDFNYFKVALAGYDLYYRVAKEQGGLTGKDNAGNLSMDALFVHTDDAGKQHAHAAAEGTVDAQGKFTFNELSYRPSAPPLFEDGSWAAADKTVSLNLGIDGVQPLALDVLKVDDGFWKSFGMVTENFDDDSNNSSAGAYRGKPDDLNALFGSVGFGKKGGVSFSLSSDLDPNKSLKPEQVKALSAAMAITQQDDSDVPWDPTKPGLPSSANMTLERVKIADSYGVMREAMRGFAGLDRSSIAAMQKDFAAGKATATDLLGARFAQASLDIGFEQVFKSLVAQEIGGDKSGQGPRMYRLKCDDGADNTFSTFNTIYVSKPYVPGQAGTPPNVLVRTVSGDYQEG